MNRRTFLAGLLASTATPALAKAGFSASPSVVFRVTTRGGEFVTLDALQAERIAAFERAWDATRRAIADNILNSPGDGGALLHLYEDDE